MGHRAGFPAGPPHAAAFAVCAALAAGAAGCGGGNDKTSTSPAGAATHGTPAKPPVDKAAFRWLT